MSFLAFFLISHGLLCESLPYSFIFKIYLVIIEMFFTLYQMLHITGPYTIYRAKSFSTTPSKRSCPRHGERPEQTLPHEKINQIHLLITSQKSVLEHCNYTSIVYTVGILYQWRFNKHLSVNQAVPTAFLLLLKCSVNPSTKWKPELSPHMANRDVLRLLPSPNWKPESSKSFALLSAKQNKLSWINSGSIMWLYFTRCYVHVHDFVFLFALRHSQRHPGTLCMCNLKWTHSKKKTFLPHMSHNHILEHCTVVTNIQMFALFLGHNCCVISVHVGF